MTPNDPLYSQQLHLDLIGDIERIWDEFSGDGVAIGVYDDGFEYTHADLAGNYDASLHFQDDTGTVYDPAPITADDAHGTAVAGIIGAVGNNNEGVVGVAFGASLTGVNALEGPIAANQALFESAMEWAQNFDVMSNSWGRTPVYGSYQNPNNANSSVAGELAGMEVAVQNGRGGLGTFISQAAGNDANDSSLAGSGIFGNANADGLNASRYTATIAATDANGDVADYSNWGSGMLVAAPAVNLTTDLTGADGYRPGDYVQGFNGTSAATPVVSGVVGLMLEANADLGWRDLQNILGISAAQTGSDFGSPAEGFEVSDWFEAAPDENWNGGGMTYSYSYGFGMVDAYAAVRMAEVWSELSGPARTSANEQIVTALPDTDTTASSTAAAVTEQIELLLPDPRNAPLSDDTELPWGDERRPLSESGSDHAPALIDGAVGPHTAPGALAPIADDGITDITFTVAESDNIEIESIAATLDFTHPDTSEVTISLITPDSLELPLFEQEAGYLSPFDAEWTFEVAALLGHGSAGTWTLRITDDTAGNTGSYDGARLEFFGADASNDDVHTITGDYLDIVAEDPARGTLTDSNGGTDWLNLAAIQGNVDLMLQSGQSFSVDGTQWGTIGSAGVDVFENAVTGDGNDTVRGNDGDNRLLGMRGEDTLEGGGGDDTLFGGTGADALSGGAGRDEVNYTTDTAGVAVRLWKNSASGGEAAGDVISGFEDVTGGSGNDTINGDGGANALKGGAGNDFLFAIGGDDSVLGGQGSDTVYGGGGDDTVEGGAGGDDLRGEGGTDLLSYTTDTAGVAVRLWNNSASGGEAAGDTISGFEDVTGGSGNDTINGDGGANALKGGAGNDFLFALGGDDSVLGGQGSDTVYGGGGDDTVEGGAGGDDLRGEGGTDLLSYTTDTAGVAVRLWNNSASGGEAAGDTISGFEDVTGGSGNDTINGDGGANALKGGAGNDFLFALGGDDTLEGGGGDDTLFGGTGADALSGGAGRDEVNYTTDTAGVAVRLWNNSASGGEAAGDVISGFEDVTGGSGNDTINGDGGANALKGGAGNDFLFAIGGDDTLLGGQGSDTVYGGGRRRHRPARGATARRGRSTFSATPPTPRASRSGCGTTAPAAAKPRATRSPASRMSPADPATTRSTAMAARTRSRAGRATTSSSPSAAPTRSRVRHGLRRRHALRRRGGRRALRRGGTRRGQLHHRHRRRRGPAVEQQRQRRRGRGRHDLRLRGCHRRIRQRHDQRRWRRERAQGRGGQRLPLRPRRGRQRAGRAGVRHGLRRHRRRHRRGSDAARRGRHRPSQLHHRHRRRRGPAVEQQRQRRRGRGRHDLRLRGCHRRIRQRHDQRRWRRERAQGRGGQRLPLRPRRRRHARGRRRRRHALRRGRGRAAGCIRLRTGARDRYRQGLRRRRGHPGILGRDHVASPAEPDPARL